MSSCTALSLTGGALALDNSTAETFTTCPRAGEYYFFRKREPAGKKPALIFGGIIHKALEARYKSGQSTIDSTVRDMMLDEVRKGYSLESVPEDDYRNYDYAVNAILHYCKLYPIEDFDIATINGVPAVEIPFAVPLGSIEVNANVLVRDTETSVVEYRDIGLLPIVWKGKIDLITRREAGLYPLDHKSTSMMGPQYWEEFTLSHQVMGYSWAIEDLMKEHVSGFIINGLGCRKPTKSGTQFEFARRTVTIHEDTLKEWYTDTMHIIGTILNHFKQGFFPKHTKWCMGKYGACKYRDVCTCLPQYRDLTLSTTMFQDVTWDPLNE